MKRPIAMILSIGLAACSPPKAPARSVADLLDDPAQLQEVIERCDANPDRAVTDPECANARAAIGRRGAQQDAAAEAQRQQQFERRRAQLREQEDRSRAAQDPSKEGFDPYTAPVAVEPDLARPKR